jgi:diaminopimelate epimerase
MAFLPIPLVKMSGAGNTFVLVDATKTSTWLGLEQKLKIKRGPFAKMVCDQTLGVSADGVLFLEGGAGHDGRYKWDFFNADGSSAEMCGNAARCAALFANEYLSSTVGGSYQFDTSAGPVSAQVLGDDRVRVIMPVIKDFQEKKVLSIDEKAEDFFFVNTGVPHLVKQISNYSDATGLKDFARKARAHKELGAAGANVTFFAREKEGSIKAVTFERGVEKYTQACGTGAVAAAYVEFKNSKAKNIDVHMPGGILNVQFSESSDHPMMTGEAVFVIEFQYFYEVMG